jgi:hypothetical protein
MVFGVLNKLSHLTRRCTRFSARCGAWLALAYLLLPMTAPAQTPVARNWAVATPAAGVAIRSAAQFRVSVVSTGAATSIDLFQLNTDGTALKLDTLVAGNTASAAGTTYVTSHMAAVYWAYSALPSASATPPVVTVTFYNDSPSVALTSMYYPSPPTLPFATGDASLLLDLDLRKGSPAGFSATGTGSFDTVKGYIPGTASGSGLADVAVPAFASAAALSQGSVVVVFERTAVTTDDSFGTSFWDSVGNAVNTTDRQLFTMRSNTAGWNLQARVVNASLPYFQVSMNTPSMTAPTTIKYSTVNSHYTPGFQDPVFATLIFTWYQNQYHVFFDGHLIAAGALGDIPILQMFQNICIGNSNAGGVATGSPLGAYAVQRVQISNRYVGPVLAGPVLGLLPDSFAADYTARANVVPTGANGSIQVSDVDAVQNSLGLYSTIAALFGQGGQTASFHQIQALLYENYGFFPPIYNAGNPGHGYTVLPIDDAYVAALNRARPTIVMAGGTINDVSITRPADATLIADTEGYLNRLSQGGGSRVAAAANPWLEHVVYLEMLSSQALPSADQYLEPAYGTESQNIITLTRAQLPSFKPANGVQFTYLDSREWWNEAADYTTYLYGSAPADRFNGAGGSDYLNPHPDALGYSVIASKLYPAMRDALLTTTGVDLTVQGAPLVVSGSTETVALTVANAGPLTAAGLSATVVLPTGVTLVTAASTAGCNQLGNTVTCRVTSLAAGTQAAFNLQLTSTGSLPTSLNVTVGDANGADATPANNSTTVAVPAPNAPTGLQATAGSGSVTLSWTASAGATSYQVFSGSATGAESTTPLIASVTSTSAVATGLTAGATYFFVVRAVSASGTSAASNEASATVPAAQTPTTGGSTSAAPAAAPSSGGGGALSVYDLAVGLLLVGCRRRVLRVGRPGAR